MAELSVVTSPPVGGDPHAWRAWVRSSLAVGAELTASVTQELGDKDLVALGDAIGVERRRADRWMAVTAAAQA